MRDNPRTIPVAGLRPWEYAPGMTYLKNLVPRAGGWTVPERYTFPWPSATQVFRGRRHTLAIEPTAIKQVDETDNSLTTLLAIAAGGGWWSFADFGEVWVLANESHLVVRKQTVSEDGYTGVYAVTAVSDPVHTVVAMHNDTRLLCASKNTLYWSAPDGSDIFTLLSGSLDSIGRTAVANQSNIMLMPFRGDIQAIVPATPDLVLVFAEDGATGLRSVGGNYGLADIDGLPLNIGIAGRASYARWMDRVVFLGTDGNIWQVDKQGQAGRLGYAEFFSGAPAFCGDPVTGDVWAGAYLLTPEGLGGPMDQVPTSTARIGGTTVATGVSAAENVTVELWTDHLLPKTSGISRITHIQGSATGLSHMQAQAKYQYRAGAGYSSTAWKQCSREGAAYMGVAILNGEAGFKASGASGAVLHDLTVRFQNNDKRYRRGPAFIITGATEEGEE
jgi:hypothetical protein